MTEKLLTGTLSLNKTKQHRSETDLSGPLFLLNVFTALKGTHFYILFMKKKAKLSLNYYQIHTLSEPRHEKTNVLVSDLV